MTIMAPWLLMVAWLSYQHGVKQDKMPEPYHFLGATGAISICALIGMLNKTIGTLLAWGLVVAVFVNVSGKTPSIEAHSEKLPVKSSGSPSTNTNPSTAPSVPGQPNPVPGPAPTRTA